MFHRAGLFRDEEFRVMPINTTTTLSPGVRRVLIIAGPNGAGKTTFAREFLPREADCPVFVNADLIAAGVAPFAPEAAAMHAGRLMLAELDRHFRARASFALETTLSGRGYLRSIRQWKNAGYRVKLLFLQLGTPEEAILNALRCASARWPRHPGIGDPASLRCRDREFHASVCTDRRRVGTLRQFRTGVGAAGLE